MRGLIPSGPDPPFLAQAFGVLDRRLDPSNPAPVAVGFSGGGDSLATLLAVSAWARRCGRPVLALTVDHRLHPESAAWTARSGAQAAALGCGWRGLAWAGEKPRAGLPAAARAARHALLAGAVREEGAAVVVLGHTADDAAEGDVMRAEDAPGLGRLREWSPSPVWPEGRGVFLLRPLLHARRAALRDWLANQGLDWLDDPANADPRFARARARILLKGAEPATFRSAHPRGSGDPGFGLAQSNAWWLEFKPPSDAETVQAWVPAFAGMSGREVQGGAIACRREAMTAFTLSAALLCASGRTVPPRRAELERLLAGIAAGEHFAATLAGARVEADAAVLVSRELGRSPPAPLALAPDKARVWDGRFEITAEAPGLAVLPVAGLAARLPPADRAALQALPAAVRPTLPLLLDAAGAVRLPEPFGGGPAHARALAPERLAAALGEVACERDIPVPGEPRRSGAAPQTAHGARGAVTLC